ncbi:MAG: hypothetical protein J6N15_13130 [Ruminiclostridium sp.]|nr:hypothetical protein [Ruminiclostridium sp.]
MDNYADSYRRYLDGDDNGLVEIIGHFRYGLTLYINGMVKDICLAEDIMQETFVKLAVKKPRFDGSGNNRTFPIRSYAVHKRHGQGYLSCRGYHAGDIREACGEKAAI